MSRNPTVLIADDDKSIVELLKHILKPLGCSFVEARDGAEAIRLAQQELPDVALLDVQMPKRTGWDVCQALKGVGRTSDIAVVLITARGDVRDRRTGLQVGADYTAGTDRVLKIMNKQITREQTERAFRIAREVGIETRGYFMVGYYDATPDDIEEMIKFSSSIGLDWASYSVATALPATDLYRIAQERGYVDGDFWRRYTINGGGPIPQLETETFTAQ